ncbi:MAG: hypothetical protein HQM13_16235 [SAR324 cluster bacterium]|nr:hypothetical protein [SAR324 cluster bacterium]
MSISIEQLAKLGQTDQELVVLQRKLSDVEKEIAGARLVVDRLEKSLKEKQHQFDEVTENRRLGQQKLGEADIFITKLEAQVPMIRTQKEFVAGKKQLEDARKHRGTIENELLECEINLDEYEADLKKLQEQMDEANEGFQKNIADLLKEQKSSTKKLEKLKKNKVELIGKLDPNIAAQYNNFLKRGITPAICQVVNKACTGCNSSLQPQFVNEMIGDPSQHRHCPFCFRILYYIPEPEKS